MALCCRERRPPGGPAPLAEWPAFSIGDSPHRVLLCPSAFGPPCSLAYRPAIQYLSDDPDHHPVNCPPENLRKILGTAHTQRGEP